LHKYYKYQKMKRILFLLVMSVLVLASCEGPAGRDGFDGRDGLDGKGMNLVVKTYTIREGDWKLIKGVNELNSYYQAEVLINELNKRVYEDGNVFCYMFQNIDGVEVQTLLPFVIPVGEKDGNKENLWTEMYSCDFSPGSIMFYVNYSDFITAVLPPTISFRVVLNW